VLSKPSALLRGAVRAALSMSSSFLAEIKNWCGLTGASVGDGGNFVDTKSVNFSRRRSAELLILPLDFVVDVFVYVYISWVYRALHTVV